MPEHALVSSSSCRRAASPSTSSGLDAGESFTTYSWVDSDTLLIVLSAARKDRFEQYTWWFPIVGRVPYKGFFNFEEAFASAARARAARLRHLHAAVGRLQHPRLVQRSAAEHRARYGDVSLASTVIHELLHNTIYVPSQIAFNESFANFVGDRGAVVFFCNRNGETSTQCAQARNAWSDNLVFGEFLSRLIADLEALYARPELSATQRIRLREEVFHAARLRFQNEALPRFHTNAFRDFTSEPLNNATLIATRLYYDRLHLFEQAFAQHNQNFQATIDWITDLARRNTSDPFGALEAALKT